MAQIVLGFAGIYFALGIFFAIYFVFFGVAKIDSVTKGASIAFRTLIIPGSVALWPLLAYKLFRQRGI